MDMRVNQPRKDDVPSHINDLCVWGSGDLTASNLADTVACDENRHPGLGLIGDTVNHPCVLH
jgi:hypothetical protein